MSLQIHQTASLGASETWPDLEAGPPPQTELEAVSPG